MMATRQGSKYPTLAWEDIGRASAAWRVAGGAVGSAWDEFRGLPLPLPDWFDDTLDPVSSAYVKQQDRLWQMMIGEDVNYDPRRDEMVGDRYADPRLVLVRPGLYGAPTEMAAHHLIAMGHLVRHCGIGNGDRVLEYGAGWGQIALTLARLGATVHTVDIDPDFCAAVNDQAKWFGVPLTGFVGEFGDNPAGGKYKLVLFYECFHHARNFLDLVEALRDLLAPDGKILMAGEPIETSSNPQFAATVPYPWGIRLDAEVAAIVRFRRWYELGFSEEFLLPHFFRRGFVFRKHPGLLSRYATIYEFRQTPAWLSLAEWPLPPDDDRTWHRQEPTGRWSTARSTITLDQAGDWSALRVALLNAHGAAVPVTLAIDQIQMSAVVPAGESLSVTLPRPPVARLLSIRCDPTCPRSYGIEDDRMLGIFCNGVEYLK